MGTRGPGWLGRPLLAWAPGLAWNAGTALPGRGSGITKVLAMGGGAGWRLRRNRDQARWLGLNLAPVLPMEALQLQLLQQPAQLQPRLLQAIGVGS